MIDVHLQGSAQVQNSFWLQDVKGRKLKDAQAALVAERLQDFVVYCTPNDAIMQESRFTSGPVTISAPLPSGILYPSRTACATVSPNRLIPSCLSANAHNMAHTMLSPKTLLPPLPQPHGRSRCVSTQQNTQMTPPPTV